MTTNAAVVVTPMVEDAEHAGKNLNYHGANWINTAFLKASMHDATVQNATNIARNKAITILRQRSKIAVMVPSKMLNAGVDGLIPLDSTSQRNPNDGVGGS